jgi:hypothetical protein
VKAARSPSASSTPFSISTLSKLISWSKSPYQAIVAFSGERDYGGTRVSEAPLNGFSSSNIAGKVQSAPDRFLICTDTSQTGYGERFAHHVRGQATGWYRTLTRLNRAHPQKRTISEIHPNVVRSAQTTSSVL